MAIKKRQLKDPLTKARQLAEEFGVRIGILLRLAGLNSETEESVLASLPYLSLKEIRRVHDSLEARIVMRASQKSSARFEEELEKIAREYNNKEEQAILNMCNNVLAPELEEEYV